ncbi:MAG: SMC-Scp complex subunit ScpB [Planctomycetes bacterium]|nr:SMC-Scp complex subunit ScpB [Planctomycetota bacterium]
MSASLDPSPSESAGAEAGETGVLAGGPAAGEIGALAPEIQGPPPEPIEIVEALLFAADSPVEPSRLAQVLGAGTGTSTARELVEELGRRLEAQGRPYEVREVAGGYQLRTRARFAPWVQARLSESRRRRLSAAVLETLAIVAYKQPILRADVEAIRGVDCGPLLKRLLDLDLVRIVKRDESLGRPILYGTTRRFLEEFGLKSIQDLPSVHELRLTSPGAL